MYVQVEKLDLKVSLTVADDKDRAYESFLYVFLEPELTYTSFDAIDEVSLLIMLYLL